MPQRLLILVLLEVLLGWGAGVSAQAQGNGPGVRGARAAALGNASVALDGDAWAVANNPAGLGSLARPTVGFYAQNRYFSAALNVGAAVVALPLGAAPGPEAAADEPGAAPVGAPATPRAWARRGVVALEAQRFGGQLYNETRVGAGYGYRLGQISVGGRVELLQISIEGLGSRRVALASLGGQVEVLPGKLTLGVYGYNLGQARLASYQDERVPTVLKAGLAYRPTAQVLLALETEKDVERPANFKAGVEYRPVGALAARVGVASLSEEISAGLGVRLRDFGLDYAAAFQAALGFSQHLSVTKTWGKGNGKELKIKN
ncbi:hypothetical protein [Hymenobacter sp. PAMC 26628]|uniref:hypothetical protein n=1 Tax=Hymenobacter sp. PAMC 26628 TaxID=1484118 RepID=UPI000AE53615|nr:hypothetical protein [Hymenobacter sp. PAMC 26628]